jgi:hypothetical protein
LQVDYFRLLLGKDPLARNMANKEMLRPAPGQKTQ